MRARAGKVEFVCVVCSNPLLNFHLSNCNCWPIIGKPRAFFIAYNTQEGLTCYDEVLSSTNPCEYIKSLLL